MNEIFKSFGNCCDNLLLENCCTTDKCKEKKCYKDCLKCDTAPFCFSPPQLPCTVPKEVRKVICLKAKIIETFLNQAFCTILEAIRTNDFSPIVVPDGTGLALYNFSNQQTIYSSFSGEPSPLAMNFLILSAFSKNKSEGCDGDSKISLKFLLKNGSTSVQPSARTTEISPFVTTTNNVAYGATFSGQSSQSVNYVEGNGLDTYALLMVAEE